MFNTGSPLVLPPLLPRLIDISSHLALELYPRLSGVKMLETPSFAHNIVNS